MQRSNLMEWKNLEEREIEKYSERLIGRFLKKSRNLDYTDYETITPIRNALRIKKTSCNHYGMKEEKVFIPSHRIQLESLLGIQEASSFKGGVILCHPHPQYGGNMDHPVITTAMEVASQEGFSTLRFNFRGVGESEGSYGEGIGEREDVKAAADYFYSRLKDNQSPLVLVGYSFGAWAGFPIAIKDERFEGMVAVAPPLEIYDFGFLKGCKKRKLIIGGDQDFFCPLAILEKWYQQIDEPKSLAIIPGADHFFLYHTPYLIQPLKDFFKSFQK